MPTSTYTRPRVNRYAGTCDTCGGPVQARAGYLHRTPAGRWMPRHLACENGTPRVTTFRLGSGATVTQNVNGRCEDAPCCGCCT